MKSWPITFKDDSSATVDSSAFLAQEVIQGRVGLAVIDYLHYSPHLGMTPVCKRSLHFSCSQADCDGVGRADSRT